MALETKDVERLASDARTVATLAAAASNYRLPEQEALGLEVLRCLDAALADARKLTQGIINNAKG